MEKDKCYLDKLDYTILESIVNSTERAHSILDMAQRFLSMRYQCSIPLNIQYPPSETKKENL